MNGHVQACGTGGKQRCYIAPSSQIVSSSPLPPLPSLSHCSTNHTSPGLSDFLLSAAPFHISLPTKEHVMQRILSLQGTPPRTVRFCYCLTQTVHALNIVLVLYWLTFAFSIDLSPYVGYVFLKVPAKIVTRVEREFSKVNELH